MTTYEKTNLLLSNNDYKYLLFSLTGIYYIISGLTFWTKFYLINSLGVEEMKASYFVSFSLLTAVVLGILVGGVVTSVLGGIDTKAAKQYILGVAFLTVPIVLPIPLVDGFVEFGVLFWLLLFAGALMMPSLYVLMMNSVLPDQRPQGNSFA